MDMINLIGRFDVELPNKITLKGKKEEKLVFQRNPFLINGEKYRISFVKNLGNN